MKALTINTANRITLAAAYGVQLELGWNGKDLIFLVRDSHIGLIDAITCPGDPLQALVMATEAFNREIDR